MTPLGHRIYKVTACAACGTQLSKQTKSHCGETPILLRTIRESELTQPASSIATSYGDVSEGEALLLIAKHHVVEACIPNDSSYWVDFVLGDGRLLGMSDASSDEPRAWCLAKPKDD